MGWAGEVESFKVDVVAVIEGDCYAKEDQTVEDLVTGAYEVVPACFAKFLRHLFNVKC